MTQDLLDALEKELVHDIDTVFGHPLGEPVTVQMKAGSDTMLISQAALKDFLRSALSRHRQAIAELARGMKRPAIGNPEWTQTPTDREWNSALQALIDRLQDNKSGA